MKPHPTVFVSFVAFGLVMLVAGSKPAPTEVSLPGGVPGIGFDDLRYSHGLQRVLVPAGRTGRLFLLDPSDSSVVEVAGFTVKAAFAGGHDDSVTSADEGDGFLFASDRSARTVAVVDPTRRRIVSRTVLSAEPDYVRWCALKGEVWVTEPERDQVEIFRFDRRESALHAVGSIRVPGGPESLVFDGARRRAYTHLWAGRTVAIDLDDRTIRDRWSNGCAGSRGIALDSGRGLLFTGCSEGLVTAVDLGHGRKRVGSVHVGRGVDIISYDPHLSHLYVPSGSTAELNVIGVSSAGALRSLGSFRTAPGARCVVSDEQGGVYVCDPAKGRLLAFRDVFPAATR